MDKLPLPTDKAYFGYEEAAMILTGIDRERLNGRSICGAIHDQAHPPQGQWKQKLEQAESINCQLISWMKEKRRISHDIAQWPTAKNLEEFAQDIGL